MNRQFTILFCLAFVFVLGINVLPPMEVQAFSNQVIQKGATGEDVVELQSRLQYAGYYHGKIDGVFGWGTYWALRNFQNKYGLKVDGVAGTDTKTKLVNSSQYNSAWIHQQIRSGNSFTYYGGTPLSQQTKSNNNGNNNGGSQNTTASQNTAASNQGNNSGASGGVTSNNLPNGYSQNDIKLMANAVYGESRGEPFKGQVAVAAVILNRVKSSKFPNTVSGVIFQPGAFTAVSDGQIWLTPNDEAKKAVLDAINGWDPSEGALYYFNPNTATSGWIWGRPQILKIGKHIFTH